MLRVVPAETLDCPMCGAPVASDAASCQHCGARLATVACPACFGLIFQGAKFCPRCGAKVERVVETAPARELCPRCKLAMDAVEVGSTRLRECPKCEGIWLDKAAFDQLCADTEKQSAVLGRATHLPADATRNAETVIRYLPCPVCRTLMNRVNFAHCSHVVVDVCAKHGTWFDRDELRQIVEFIRAGGMDKARAIEAERLKESRDRLESGPGVGAWDSGSAPCGGYGLPGAKYDVIALGIAAAVRVLAALFK